MATTITNQSQTTYQFSGSGDILTTDSNVNEITLEDTQNLVITKLQTQQLLLLEALLPTP